MSGVSKVMLMGNLGDDPETRAMPSGRMVANFRVATDHRFKDKEGRSPARWQDLDRLELRGKAARSNPPRFARLRWAPLR